MATCSSILAWKIPWAEEPGRLQSMGLQKRHDWATNIHSSVILKALIFMHALSLCFFLPLTFHFIKIILLDIIWEPYIYL